MRTFMTTIVFAALLTTSLAFAGDPPAPSTVSPRGTEGPDVRYAAPSFAHAVERQGAR